jgi:hypothetical protein
MKPQIQRKIALALALAASAVLTGCGSNSGSAVPGVAVPAIAVGGVYSSVGGACVPITTPIGFTVSGMSAYTVDAQGDAEYTLGTIPGGQPAGSGSLYAGPPPSSVSSQTFTSQGVSGSFEIQVANTAGVTTYGTPYSGYTGTNLTGAGEITISPTLQSQIADYVQLYGVSTTTTTAPFPTYGGYSGSPYGGTGYNYSGSYNPASVCVSGIAIQGYLYAQDLGANAQIYLYLNNTQHGYILQFY